MSMQSLPITSVRENVDRIELGDKTIYLVGTAHVSQSSADLAEEIIRDVKPNAVAIELCHSRYDSLKNPDKWKKTDIVAVLREGRGYVLMAQLILAAFQKKLGKNLKVSPGAEMLRAMKVADELGIATVLADRDIKTTLKRTWHALGFRSLATIVAGLLQGLFGSEQIEEAEIERLKSADALEELMKDFTAALPTVRTALIDERDRYLAAKIGGAPGATVVAVVGAGHVPGIKRWLGSTIDVAALDVIPPEKLSRRIIGWSIPALLIGMLVYGFVSAGSGTSTEMLAAWAWTTAVWAAFGSMIALAHPVTVLAAFVVAPFAAANPFIASGWIAGIVEALIRRPTVGDFESIGDDIATVKGVWRNRVSRILLVMLTTNLFGGLGTVLGLGRLWHIAH